LPQPISYLTEKMVANSPAVFRLLTLLSAGSFLIPFNTLTIGEILKNAMHYFAKLYFLYILKIIYFFSAVHFSIDGLYKE